ncbi:MAG: outer membrane beta-barrel protein [Proteobacteria bacterium]|nr:outer membrane beta-barrel protein [Pseudomonadota bacterium]
MKKIFPLVAAVAVLLVAGMCADGAASAAPRANPAPVITNNRDAVTASPGGYDFYTYASFKLGYEYGDVRFGLHSVNGFGGQVAYGFIRRLWLFDARGELEMGYYNQRQDRGGRDTRLNPLTIMANVYADLGQASWALSPYLGFGIGYANVTEKTTSPGFSDSTNHNGFAWGAYAGFTFGIVSDLRGDLAFRFGQIDLGGETLDNFGGTLGLQYRF